MIGRQFIEQHLLAERLPNTHVKSRFNTIFKRHQLLVKEFTMPLQNLLLSRQQKWRLRDPDHRRCVKQGGSFLSARSSGGGQTQNGGRAEFASRAQRAEAGSTATRQERRTERKGGRQGGGGCEPARIEVNDEYFMKFCTSRTASRRAPKL